MIRYCTSLGLHYLYCWENFENDLTYDQSESSFGLLKPLMIDFNSQSSYNRLISLTPSRKSISSTILIQAIISFLCSLLRSVLLL